MKTRSKIDDLFWEKRLGCGDHRFCKLCWSQEEEVEVPEVEKVQHLIEAGFSPSTSFRGCVLNRSSPANMMNHINAKHQDHSPQNSQEGRTAASTGEKKASIDLTLLRDWAANLVLGDNDDLRAVLQDCIPGLAHSSRLQEEVDSVVGDLRAEVQKRVAEAVKQGAKFVLRADQQGFVQEALVATGLDTKEQLPLIPGQRFHSCLKGESTTDWKGYAGLGAQTVLIPKMAARPVIYKGGCSSRSDGLADGATGAMPDASKRRLDEGWEVMPADSWKPRMRIRHSYVAVYLHCMCPETWKREAVCVRDRQMHPPRNGQCYRALRRGLRLLGPIPGQALPVVGYGCHAAQWLAEHLWKTFLWQQFQFGTFLPKNLIFRITFSRQGRRLFRNTTFHGFLTNHVFFSRAWPAAQCPGSCTCGLVVPNVEACFEGQQMGDNIILCMGNKRDVWDRGQQCEAEKSQLSSHSFDGRVFPERKYVHTLTQWALSVARLAYFQCSCKWNHFDPVNPWDIKFGITLIKPVKGVG